MEDVYPSSYPSGSAPGNKLQKPLKEAGIFQSFGTINLFFFTKRRSQKGGGGGEGGMAQCPFRKYVTGSHYRQYKNIFAAYV